MENGMILIEGGVFKMGSDDYENEQPVHEVRLDSFYMSRFQIMVKEFKRFVEETNFQTDADKKGGVYFSWTGLEWTLIPGFNWKDSILSHDIVFEYNNPVLHVSWYDAVAYCNWLSTQNGLEKVYTINEAKITARWNAGGYRLPSEAEWEYAARGGNKSMGFTYAGSNTLDEVGWHSKNSGRLGPKTVGQKQANELGLYDMSGNVWEWCWNWYGRDYYKTGPNENPQGPDKGQYRVVRGGSWCNTPTYLRSSNRANFHVDGMLPMIGFRVARGVAFSRPLPMK